MNWQKKSFLASGVKTYYFDIGSGEPVVFFHGGGVGSVTYRRNLELLSCKYRVIAPDLPCFGNADVPKTAWNFDDYGDYFSAFLESLNLENVTVIGHSFGGGVALAVAAKSPKITRLILANSAGLTPHYSDLFFIIHLGWGIVEDLFRFRKYLVVSMFRDLIMVMGKKVINLPAVWATIKKSIWEDSLEKYSANISADTLILWGENDWLYPNLIFAREFQKEIAGSRLEIINNTHGWFLYEPEAVVEVIRRFLERDKDNF